MGVQRTAWHVLFAALIEERAPPDVEVVAEHILTQEPQKADLLLIRRSAGEHQDQRARVLRRLWPMLTKETLVEFKSLARPARRGDWIRLLGYGAQHHAKQVARLGRAGALTLVLIVPAMTPTVREETKLLGWSLAELGDGYYRVHGSEYPGILVVLGEAAKSERDDLLGWFASAKLKDDESARWLMTHTKHSREGTDRIQDLEGYEEMLRSFFGSLSPEHRAACLADIPLEGRLAGLSPEERLAGLPADQAVLALPVEVLRGLTAEFIATLPEAVQAEVRRRLNH